ncbi:MAG: hypothetical protein ACI9DC_004528 [Gammaproteobacteria bacterium]|jgi:hypothetical protein
MADVSVVDLALFRNGNAIELPHRSRKPAKRWAFSSYPGTVCRARTVLHCTRGPALLRPPADR